MHLRTLSLSFVLLLLGFAACLAQQPTGPATLENLLLPDKAQKPAAAGVGPKRFVGSVVRPQDGVKHPDLDKGWAVYDAAAAKAAESIKAAILKQFDAATAKGDLDNAEKWQATLEKFEKTGELPTEKEAKTAVSAAVADYKKAKDELSKAYEAVVTALTMEKKITEAKAVREESRSLSKASDAVVDKEQDATNVAVGRPCKQSSVYRGTGFHHGPDLGVDGESRMLPSPKGLVITGPDNPPWWQVDLEQIRTLKELKFYNRKDCCQERARTLKVLLSANGFGWQEVYSHNRDGFDELTIDLKGQKARFVRLQLAEPVQFHFRECEVYGH